MKHFTPKRSAPIGLRIATIVLMMLWLGAVGPACAASLRKPEEGSSR